MQCRDRLKRCLQRCQHDGQIFWLATSHHRVDSDFLDGAGRQIRWYPSNYFFRFAAGAAEHTENPLIRWRHNRQPIAPAALISRFNGIVPITNLYAARGEARVPVASDEMFKHAGLASFRTAARLKCGQILPQAYYTGHPLPFRAAPADRAIDLSAIGEANERGYRFDIVQERLL